MYFNIKSSLPLFLAFYDNRDLIEKKKQLIKWKLKLQKELDQNNNHNNKVYV